MLNVVGGIMSLEVYTWKSGTKGWGFSKPVKSRLLGGNVGHAAVELSFPANEKGNELAQKYQDIPGLSIRKRTETIPEKQENGSYKPKDQVNYFVYFSWWPGSNNGHYINTRKEDLVSEWDNEPAPILKREVHEHIFGENVPTKNKTHIMGTFVRQKEITKLKEFSHEQLKKSVDEDLAYQELKAEEASLQGEWDQLALKEQVYLNEKRNAELEQREPSNELKLTKNESDRIGTITENLIKLKAQIELCKKEIEERHISLGEPPSAIIRIPTTLDHNSLTFALDAEKVLDKMASLAQSKTDYSFFRFNCSTAATEIVKAGISNELKNSMKADGFNVVNASKATIATPTSFSNFCKQIQEELLHLNANQASIEQQKIETARSSQSPQESLNFKARYHEFLHNNAKARDSIDIEEVDLNMHFTG